MQPLSHTIPRVVAEIVRNAPLSPGKVKFAWTTVVGPAVDRMTEVRLEGTTLLVDAKTTAWGREVTRSSHGVLRQLQRLLGTEAIKEIVVRA